MYLLCVLLHIDEATYRVRIRIYFILWLVLPIVIWSPPYLPLTHEIAVHIVEEIIGGGFHIGLHMQEVVSHASISGEERSLVIY